MIEDAITALRRLNNNRDRILALYEAMRRDERFDEELIETSEKLLASHYAATGPWEPPPF